jgi:alpha-beta hydrolase superfamily lysophospholipase
VKAAVLALRFLTELTLLAVLAAWGASAGGSLAADLALGLGAPLAAAAVWGLWIGPRSGRRLPDPGRLLLEVALFALGGLALAGFGSASAGLVFSTGAILLAFGVRQAGEELALR